MDIPEFPASLHAKELKLLLEQLDAENESISFLLKAHLYAEYHLERLLSTYLGNKVSLLERFDLKFAQKLSLVDSYALLSTQCISSLYALNKLRNRCVHTFNTRPTSDDVLKVVSCLGQDFRAEWTTGDVKDISTGYLWFSVWPFRGRTLRSSEPCNGTLSVIFYSGANCVDSRGVNPPRLSNASCSWNAGPSCAPAGAGRRDCRQNLDVRPPHNGAIFRYDSIS